MSDLAILPDAEWVVVRFLRGQPELAGIRVGTSVPPKPTFPTVRVVRWGGVPLSSRPLWVDNASCQVDVWANGKAEVMDVAALVRALLSVRLVGSQPGVVVTAVTFGIFSDEPDDTYSPAKPRVRFDITVTLHPDGSDTPALETKGESP